MNTNKSSSVKLCLAWFVVAVPLSWGVFKSVQKSMPLFGMKSAAAVAQPK